MLLGTSFTDCFIRGIFPYERKFVPWHSLSVGILVSSKYFKLSKPAAAVVNMPIGATHKTDIEVSETLTTIRMACQALLQRHTDCRVIVTASASGIHTIEPKILGEPVN